MKLKSGLTDEAVAWWKTYGLKLLEIPCARGEVSFLEALCKLYTRSG